MKYTLEAAQHALAEQEAQVWPTCCIFNDLHSTTTAAAPQLQLLLLLLAVLLHLNMLYSHSPALTVLLPHTLS
jgi:hypothetical protein